MTGDGFPPNLPTTEKIVSLPSRAVIIIMQIIINKLIHYIRITWFVMLNSFLTHYLFCPVSNRFLLSNRQASAIFRHASWCFWSCASHAACTRTICQCLGEPRSSCGDGWRTNMMIDVVERLVGVAHDQWRIHIPNIFSAGTYKDKPSPTEIHHLDSSWDSKSFIFPSCYQ